MNPHIIRYLSFLILLVMILNLILFALGKIGSLIFWGIIIAGALFAYQVLPRLNGEK